ncbi:MAG TPA: hypothetical protein VLG46_08875, partial [Anaerolineae bacterium]|nr:hypothetical protein [Anaerolineae bacterium]
RSHFVLQRVFHRDQYLYDKLLYIYTAILVLFQVISVPAFFLPAGIASFLTYLLVAYQFVLLVLATRAIAGVMYWQALVTVLSAVAAGALILACTLPVMSSLLSAVTRISR